MQWQRWASVGLLIALGLAGFWLQGQTGGRTLVFALVCGLVLGVAMQRSRFCFYCHTREYLEDGNPRGVLALLLAMAVGLLGYTVILSSWLPNPMAGNSLPPDMHIGPVSWVLVLAGLSFGAGMVVSGSCISAHWYRLAEGSVASPFALLGTAIGFILGFKSWNGLYSLAIADAPVVWLPAHLGYGGALLLQLGVLGLLAAWVWRSFAKEAPVPASAGGGAPVPGLAQVWSRLWQGRWSYWTGGLVVGLVGAFAIVQMRPLGVTATLGSVARDFANERQWIPLTLHGLDSLGGCATVLQGTYMTPNGLLLAGIVGGSFVAALASGQWAFRLPGWGDVARGLSGGVLLGWGAMTALGCTVGNLLSGTQAGALSGWVFGVSMLVALWAGLKIKRGLARRWA
ncbi:hypothetical protein SAMN02745117_02356 [Lampropedia hyalina DSM 16112]|jgi:uncharacterized membrane protein YedE/YeeE|uniref:Uncharacterized protein n=1 Tax=Lampropedia hyalina DSM 16112 TaxID=1122156 RepID=A0A1M5DBT9_9BURK|nr:YeeE/YedE family protein [Lampropedia hyalina]SHF64518.1 hypothetical protein SAMN02745117_02356 [Lampropedia hyalina DSM 16112]